MCYGRFQQICMGCFFERQKRTTIVNVFQTILKESNRKPNKIWVD